MSIATSLKSRLVGITGRDLEIVEKIQQQIKPFFQMESTDAADIIYLSGFDSAECKEDYYIGVIQYDIIQSGASTIYEVSDFYTGRDAVHLLNCL